MNKQPLVSIITPSYNQAQFLEATIRSVLDQDYPHSEYIICDGGSTDGSVEIIRKYANSLAWWCSERDGGQSEAINKGMTYARGQILAWLNSDDRYLPGCISTIVAAFKVHPRAGMIHGNVEIIDEQGRRIGRFPTQRYTFADQLTQRMTIPQPGAFWCREVMETIGPLRTDLHYAMDYEFWIRIGRHYPVKQVNQTLAQYRVSNASKGGSQSAGWGPEFMRILDRLYSAPDLPAEILSLKRRAYAGAYYRGAGTFLTAFDTKTARAWLMQAVRLDRSYLGVVGWWFSFLRSMAGSHINGWGRSVKSNIRQWHTETRCER